MTERLPQLLWPSLQQAAWGLRPARCPHPHRPSMTMDNRQPKTTTEITPHTCLYQPHGTYCLQTFDDSPSRGHETPYLGPSMPQIRQEPYETHPDPGKNGAIWPLVSLGVHNLHLLSSKTPQSLLFNRSTCPTIAFSFAKTLACPNPPTQPRNVGQPVKTASG
jgi:hypothetical protein